MTHLYLTAKLVDTYSLFVFRQYHDLTPPRPSSIQSIDIHIYTKPSPVTHMPLTLPQLTSTFKLRVEIEIWEPELDNWEFFGELVSKLVLPFLFVSRNATTGLFCFSLPRQRVHLFFSNGPSSGVPWGGVPRWKPIVLLFQIYWFISPIRQRKYFNLCWFIWVWGPRLCGLETQQVPKINTEMEMSRHREQNLQRL